MSVRPPRTRIPSHPVVLVLLAAALVTGAIAVMPSSLANTSNPTSAPDVILDAGRSSAAYYDGTYLGTSNVVISPVAFAPTTRTSYDVTFNNLSASVAAVYLVSQTNVSVSGGAASTYDDPANAGKKAATFPSIQSPAAGIYLLRNGSTTGDAVGSVYFGPKALITLTVTPNGFTYTSQAVTMTYNATNASGPVGGALLKGPMIASGTTTLPDGTRTIVATPPGPGTYRTEASLQRDNMTTNGVDVPEENGTVSWTVYAVSPLVRINSVAGSILYPVTTPIRLENVSAFGSATVKLAYDPAVVEVQNVSNGSIPNATLHWDLNATQGVVTVLVTTTARPGPIGSFDLVRVQLRTVGAAGSTSALDLTVEELTDSNGTALNATVVDGTFRAGILGDADGDGDIDQNDVLAMSDVVVGKAPLSSIVAYDADVSRDGRVTGVDVMMLRQHLAGTRPTL